MLRAFQWLPRISAFPKPATGMSSMTVACSPIIVSTIFVSLNLSLRTTNGRMRRSVASEKRVNVRSCAQSGPPTWKATRIATRKAPAAKNALCIVVVTNSSARKKKPISVQIHQSITRPNFWRGTVIVDGSPPGRNNFILTFVDRATILSRLHRREGFIQMKLRLAVVLATCVAIVPSVFAVSNTVVISQVYGGGGNSGATLKNDFIELFNRG